MKSEADETKEEGKKDDLGNAETEKPWRVGEFIQRYEMQLHAE